MSSVCGGADKERTAEYIFRNAVPLAVAYIFLPEFFISAADLIAGIVQYTKSRFAKVVAVKLSYGKILIENDVAVNRLAYSFTVFVQQSKMSAAVISFACGIVSSGF